MLSFSHKISDFEFENAANFVPCKAQIPPISIVKWWKFLLPVEGDEEAIEIFALQLV